MLEFRREKASRRLRGKRVKLPRGTAAVSVRPRDGAFVENISLLHSAVRPFEIPLEKSGKVNGREQLHCNTLVTQAGIPACVLPCFKCACPGGLFDIRHGKWRLGVRFADAKRLYSAGKRL